MVFRSCLHQGSSTDWLCAGRRRNSFLMSHGWILSNIFFMLYTKYKLIYTDYFVFSNKFILFQAHYLSALFTFFRLGVFIIVAPTNLSEELDEKALFKRMLSVIFKANIVTHFQTGLFAMWHVLIQRSTKFNQFLLSYNINSLVEFAFNNRTWMIFFTLFSCSSVYSRCTLNECQKRWMNPAATRI